jgi:DNA polymerase III subunit epsilon
MNSALIVLDFETTGMSPNLGARPTEVAAVRVENGRIVERYKSLMNAGVYVPTGSTNMVVREAPSVDQVIRELNAFNNGQPIAAQKPNKKVSNADKQTYDRNETL